MSLQPLCYVVTRCVLRVSIIRDALCIFCYRRDSPHFIWPNQVNNSLYHVLVRIHSSTCIQQPFSCSVASKITIMTPSISTSIWDPFWKTGSPFVLLSHCDVVGNPQYKSLRPHPLPSTSYRVARSCHNCRVQHSHRHRTRFWTWTWNQSQSRN